MRSRSRAAAKTSGVMVSSEARKFAFSQLYPIEFFEFLAEVSLQRSAITNIGAILVFEAAQLFDESVSISCSRTTGGCEFGFVLVDRHRYLKTLARY